MRRAALALVLAACVLQPQKLPRFAEALVVVDTDLPAPSIASDVRIDFFRDDGAWFESRDLPVPDAQAWPLSFSVFSSDEARDTRVLLRIRVYPSGRQRGYRGDPRLVRGQHDETPPTEPLPSLTIDRLVRLRLVPNAIGRVTIVLRGVCAGMIVSLAPALRTCIDREGVLEEVGETPLDPDVRATQARLVGTFGAEQTCGSSDDPNFVCVPSAAFLFGGPRLGGINIASTMPDRVVRLSRYFMDRQEVSVGRFRRALTGGLPRPSTSQLRTVHEMKNANACTFDDQAGTNDDFPVNCILWDSARAFCQFRGGDLPTEPQWELAASGGRPFKSKHPWGDRDPRCAPPDAVYGRAFPDLPGGLAISNECEDAADAGPAPERNDIDRSELGIFALAGSVAEWTRDTGVDYANDCWRLAPSVDPSCTIAGDGRHATRGGSWLGPSSQLDDTFRDILPGNFQENAHIGFRCVYSTLPASWQ